MRKSSWEVLHAKAVEDKFEKSLETNSSRLVVRYVFVNGLVKRWRESLGDRKSTRLNSSHREKSRMPSSA